MRLPIVFASAVVLLTGVALGASDADLDAAHRLARAGKTDEALAAAQAAARAAPDDAAPGRLIQDLLRAEGRDTEIADAVPSEVSLSVATLLNARTLPPEKAEPALEALLGKDGAPAQTHLDLALTYLALGKTRTAEASAKTYVEHHPDDAEGHLVVARARLASGRALAAQEPAETALSLAPGWAPAVDLFAEVVTELGRPAEARLAYTDALKTYPDSPALVRGLAMDQLRADEPEAAEATLTRLVALRGKRVGPRVLLADVQTRLGKLAEAEATVRAAMELDPGSAEAHRMLGLLLEKKDDFEGALAEYDAALDLRPDWAQGWLDRGVVLTLLDELDAAAEALEHAVRLDEDLLEAQFRLAQVRYFQDDLKAAKKGLDKLLRADDEHVAAQRLMGRVLLASQKAKTALKHFRRAAELDPTDSDSMRMIGKTLLELGKPEEALTALANAIDRDPDDPWSQMEFGKALEATERFEDAEDYYRKAIELAPAKPHAYFYLAQLLDDFLDKPEEALEHYKKFLELGGDDPDDDVKNRIEQLGP